jgi:hypothetical protein
MKKESLALKEKPPTEALSELMDREADRRADVFVQIKPQQLRIMGYKRYPLTVEESRMNYEAFVANAEWNIEKLKNPDVKMDSGLPIDEKLRNVYINMLRGDIANRRKRLGSIEQGDVQDFVSEPIFHQPLEPVIGKQALEASERIAEVRRELDGLYSDLSKKNWEIIRQREQSKRGLSLADMKAFVHLEDLTVRFKRVCDRLKKEPLLEFTKSTIPKDKSSYVSEKGDVYVFLHQQLLAAVNKKHDKIYVEKFDPRQIEDLYQVYLDKYQEYRKKIMAYAPEEKPKPGSDGPYR